jgi:hypothetical protein
VKCGVVLTKLAEILVHSALSFVVLLECWLAMLKASVVAAAIFCSFPATGEDKPNRVERTVDRAVKGTENTAKRAGKFVQKTATRSGKFVERTATKVDRSVKRALE